jgi:hypothetical protein
MWDGEDGAELQDLIKELEWRCENHPHGWTVEDHLRGWQDPCQPERQSHMTETDYEYGIGTRDVEPILRTCTLERAQERLDKLQPKVGEPLVIWRRQRPEWEMLERAQDQCQ